MCLLRKYFQNLNIIFSEFFFIFLQWWQTESLSTLNSIWQILFLAAIHSISFFVPLSSLFSGIHSKVTDRKREKSKEEHTPERERERNHLSLSLLWGFSSHLFIFFCFLSLHTQEIFWSGEFWFWLSDNSKQEQTGR